MLRAKKQEERERKQQEIEQKRIEAEEAKRKREEEREELRKKKEEERRCKEEEKKRKEEDIQRKKDEEAKRKEELLKAQRDKENAQRKLVSFFNKNQPKEKKTEVENKIETTDVMRDIRRLTDGLQQEFSCNLKEYCELLKSKYQNEKSAEEGKFKDKPRRKDIFIEGSHIKMC